MKWLSYYKHKRPSTTELQLARLTLLVAQGLGSKTAKFEDFLVNNHKPKAKEMSADQVQAVFSGVATPMK